MPSWRITFEGGAAADGTTFDETSPAYTPDAADILTSGWSVTENTGTGGLIKISTVRASAGTRSLRLETTASTSCYFQQNEDGTWGSTRWYVADIYIPTGAAIPANWDVIQIREAATLYRLRITTARLLAVVNGSSQLAASAAAIPLDTWYRVSLKVVVSATVGVLEAKMYAGNSSTPVETVTQSGLNTGTILPTNVRSGIPIAFGPAGPFWLDEPRASDVSEPGPSGAAPGTLFGTPKVKVWNGTSWIISNKVKYFNGSTFNRPKIRPYN